MPTGGHEPGGISIWRNGARDGMHDSLASLRELAPQVRGHAKKYK